MVCELAGMLQGLLPEELRDLGRASLDQEHINNLLDLVSCENDITDLFCKILAAKSSSYPLKSRSVASQKRKGVVGSRAILHSSKRLHMRQRFDSFHTWKLLTKWQ